MVYGSSTITQLFLCSMHITKYVIINIQTVRSAYFYIDIEGQVRAIVWYVTCEWHNCWRYIFVLFFLLFCERTRQELCTVYIKSFDVQSIPQLILCNVFNQIPHII